MSNPTEPTPPEQLVLLEPPEQPEIPCEWDFDVIEEKPPESVVKRPPPGWIEITHSMVIRSHTGDIIDAVNVVHTMANVDTLDKAANLGPRICRYLDELNKDWHTDVYHYSNGRLAEYKLLQATKSSVAAIEDAERMQDEHITGMRENAQAQQFINPPTE